MDFYNKASSIVKELSLQEKCKFCCGIDFWHLFGIEKFDIPSIMICDGPHGLRKENLDKLILNKSVKSTCFPTATALACTFDEELINRMGKALGEECRKENVAVILSPGINIKRLPTCGRNFEYFSEDPYVSGKIGAALINGIQSIGVGASIKHFAANNQEKNRYTVNSIIDERALREIYLKGFEIAIKESNPNTVMMAYNKLNNQYCCENKYLIKDILRNEWKYNGCIISDWGGVNDIISSINNGLNLEMPGYNDDYYKVIEKAVKSKKIDEKVLDESVTKVIELILKYKEGTKIPYRCNIQEHINLAQEIAEDSAVLLKNKDSILPGNDRQNIAVIGKLAKSPIYQGVGSSQVNVNTSDNAYDAFLKNNCNITYAPGYSFKKDYTDENLKKEAIKIAQNKDIVYLFLGIPKYYEAEGYDRKDMKLPKDQEELIYEIGEVNKNLVVILQGGSPIEMSWDYVPKAILLTHLSGCRGGNATVNLLLGKKNPSGKLSETYANELSDYPSTNIYSENPKHLEYRESIFVGYRYFDTFNKEVKYPFGFGLSYTTFEYSDIKISHINDEKIRVSITIRNEGDVEGKEVVQLYVSCLNSKIFRAKQELKGFKKVNLKPGESKEVIFYLDKDHFTYYNIKTKKFEIEEGKYSINIGSSSRNIKFSSVINKKGTTNNVPYNIESTFIYYNRLSKNDFQPSEEEYENIYGKNIPIISEQLYPFTPNSTINDIKYIHGGKLIISLIDKMAYKFIGKDKYMQIAITESFNESPFRFIIMGSRGVISRKMISGFVNLLNKHYIKGLVEIIKGIKFH